MMAQTSLSFAVSREMSTAAGALRKYEPYIPTNSGARRPEPGLGKAALRAPDCEAGGRDRTGRWSLRQSTSAYVTSS